MNSALEKMIWFMLLLNTAPTALAFSNNAKQSVQEYGTVEQVPLPPIDLNEWWGPGNGTGHQDTAIRNFTIQFKNSMVSDLKYRLSSHVQFQPPLEGVAFNYGFSSSTLENWIKYLSEKYPFKQREKYLNQYSHYKTSIQGLKIHFMRITSKTKSHKKVPLLLLHGWPGSIREFYETVPHILSMGEEKRITFDLIIPSLPGYGFSDGAVRPHLGVDKAAVIMRNMMHSIGYKKYYIQGGDMGSLVGSIMATYFPTEVLGYHTNFPLFFNPNMIFSLIMGNYHKEQIARPELLDRIYPSWDKFFNIMAMTGYMHIQATKPDQVGIGLSDSPSGLIAYILEKFSSWVRPNFINYTDGGLTQIFTAEQLMDNIMIYWSTNSITTSMRMYADTLNKRFIALRLNEIQSRVPIWVLQAKDELIYLPGWLIRQKFPNLLHENTPSEGGHFYAWEKPKLFAKDVVNAVVAFRKWHALNSTRYTKCSMYT